MMCNVRHRDRRHELPRRTGVRPALEVDAVVDLIQRQLVVACRGEVGPGSCQEAR